MDVGQARDVGFHGRGVKLVIFSIVFTVVAMAFVAARVFKRVHTGRKLYHEDFVIVASVVSLFIPSGSGPSALLLATNRRYVGPSLTVQAR